MRSPGLTGLTKRRASMPVVGEHRADTAHRRTVPPPPRSGSSRARRARRTADCARACRLVHVRVEVVAGERRRSARCPRRVTSRSAEWKVSPMASAPKGLRNGCTPRIALARPAGPAPGHRRDHVGRALHGGALHVVHHARGCRPSPRRRPARPGPPCTRCGSGEPWPVDSLAQSRFDDDDASVKRREPEHQARGDSHRRR